MSMSDFISLPGRDISPPIENIRNANSLSRSDVIATRPPKTVVISVMKEGGDVEYAIVPLKPSYSEAVATAYEALSDHLRDFAPDSVCLKMATKNFDGELIWASISPVSWNEIVSDGTELRIFPKSTPTIPLRASQFSGGVHEDRPTITIKLPEASAKDGRARYVTILLPKSYDEARRLAFNKLKGDFKTEKSSCEQVVMRGLIEEETRGGTVSFETFISAHGTDECLEWEHLIIQMKKEYPRFKILMV